MLYVSPIIVNMVILEVLIVCFAVVLGGCYPQDGCIESSGMVPLSICASIIYIQMIAV